MGNHINNIEYCDAHENQLSPRNRTISHFLKSKFRHNKLEKPKRISHEDLIVQYSQKHKNRDAKIIQSWDQRRVVFVSLLGAYQTWNKCPSAILYTSLFIMPLKRNWIYHPHKYRDEIRSTFLSQLSWLSDMSNINEFMNLLKWKDSQGLVLWMLDEYNIPKTRDYDRLIEPFWYHVSATLSGLYDPITQSTYNPLDLNAKWVKDSCNCNRSSVLYELYFLKMKYKAMMEILSHSNASLNPIISFSVDAIASCPSVNPSACPIYNDVDVDVANPHEDMWWISNEYDPYDIQPGVDKEMRM
eukprot:161692_1